MLESQYIESYLTAAARHRWTPGTYLTYTLRGKAKRYSGHYYRALMRAIDRRLAAGTVVRARSAHGYVTYIPTPSCDLCGAAIVAQNGVYDGDTPIMLPHDCRTTRRPL